MRRANPYKHSSIYDLNMMSVHEYRRGGLSVAEVVVTAAPLVAAALVLLATFVPELSFFAECQNIPGGDVCSISLK